MKSAKPSTKDLSLLDKAQQLVYDAWDANTAKKAIALAKEALKISPLCADAYVLLAGRAKAGSEEQLVLWQKGVEAGEAALGRSVFRENEGEFWLVLETRPYMRARCGLSLALWDRGDRDEAIEHVRDLLRLNPSDNQGARYVLAAWLAELGRDDELEELLDKYEEDASAAWYWTLTLLAYRRSGNSVGSRERLAEAMLDNPHVADYLVGKRKTPTILPQLISPGEESEAICFVDEFGEGWRRTDGAIEWLRGRIG